MRFPLLSICPGLFAVNIIPLASAAEPAPPFEAMLKIDVHSHVFEDVPEIHAHFRRLNVRTINVCNNGTDGHLEQMHAIAFDLYRQHPALYPFESTFDLLKRDETDYAKNVIAWLGHTFEGGAVGVKIWKPYLRGPATDAQRKGYINRLDLQYRAGYDYYAGKGPITYNNRKVEALNLPRRVLEKFYHANAERIFKLDVAWAGRN